MNPFKFQQDSPLQPQPVRFTGTRSAGAKSGKVILFPGNPGSPRTSSAGNTAPDPGPAAAKTSLQVARRKGLQLVEPGVALKKNLHESTQERAHRIVAQVEWELEQKAARERQQRLFGVVPQQLAAVLPLRLDTPASLARRVFASLFSVLRTA